MYHLHHVPRLWLILGYIFIWINGSALAQLRLQFLREPERQIYLEPGKINQLDCSYDDDSGNIHQLWYLNDQLINHEFTNVLPNGTLRFEVYEDTTSTQRDKMEGLYRCCISDGSLTLCSITSHVSFPSISPPEVIASTVNAKIGDVLRLACHTETDPAGIITWLKDDANIAFDETRLVLLPSDVIQITEVIGTDQGQYKCRVENTAGTIVSPSIVISASSQLSPDESHDTRGEILNQAVTEVFAEAGGEAFLECLVRQAKRVDIYWTNGSTSVPKDRRQILGYGNILLKNLTLNDTGNYTCTSVDKRTRKVRSIRVKLTVQCPPGLVTSEPKLSRSEGLTISLKCRLSGIPEPEFAWYHNGERVMSVGRYSYTHSSDLYIYNIGYEDAGLFQCFAWNLLGSVYATTLLTVSRSVDRPVRDLHITNITSTTAIARWKTPSFTSDSENSCKAFVIYYSKLPDGIELSDPIPATQDHWVLEELDPYSNYSVSVRAVTADYSFSLLETVYMKTLEDVPSDAPEIVSVTSTSTTVTLEWLPLNDENSNGVIVHQEVCLEQEAAGYLNCVTLGPSQTSYTFEDLVPGVEYLTYVSAETSVGKGVNSDKYPRITPISFNCTAPEIVPIHYKVVNSTFIMFMWQSANGTQRELIRGYRLSITAVNSDRRVDFLLLDASAEGYNKTNAGYDTYYVTFYAIGDCGQGPASTARIQMPEEITVDVSLVSPNNLKTETLDKDKIKVIWSHPTTQEMVESYTIGYSAIGQPEDSVQGIEPDYSSSRMEHILSGLETYTFYRIRVIANYPDGTRHASNYVHWNTGEDKPGSAPRDVHADTLDSTSINITWKPPLTPNGIIIYYTINYWGSNDLTAGWRQIKKLVDDDSPSTLSMILRDLQPNTRYSFYIRAATHVGKGPQTQLYNISTQGPGKGITNKNKLADLRKGIITGVCLALLCIAVCVSLLVYHLRRSICKQQEWQCRSVASRTSTPGHHKSCRHRSRRWTEHPDPDCSLSVLQTEFEMEHLMMRDRPTHASERLMIQVHHTDNDFPVRGATSENSFEERFQVHREPPSPSDHQDTSHELPPDAELPVIPHKGLKDQQSLQQCAHCTSSTSDFINPSSTEGVNVAAASASGGHSPALAHHDRILPANSQPHKSNLYSNDTLPWSPTSEDCQNVGPNLSHPTHYSGQSQEDPYCCLGACQTEENFKIRDKSSGCKLQVDVCVDPQVYPQVDDQQEEISSIDGDSGLDGESSSDEVLGTQDTSPNFLEKVLEELSAAD